MGIFILCKRQLDIGSNPHIGKWGGSCLQVCEDISGRRVLAQPFCCCVPDSGGAFLVYKNAIYAGLLVI